MQMTSLLNTGQLKSPNWQCLKEETKKVGAMQAARKENRISKSNYRKHETEHFLHLVCLTRMRSTTYLQMLRSTSPTLSTRRAHLMTLRGNLQEVLVLARQLF